MKRRVTALLSALVFCLSGCGTDVDLILGNDLSEAEEEADAEESAGAKEDAEEAKETDDTLIYVYICGAVKVPGVYETDAQSRLYELVDLAGGFTGDADECSVNLAQVVQDGEMIRIPTLEESAEGMTPAAGETASAADAGSGKININTADAEQLTALTGIGEVKAAAIVSYREEHGFFQSTEQLMEVSGIGESTYDKIKDDITI